ncbi:hypothetical protein [Methylobacter luteus]|uniref:hypothetical protein n=1 Tax=Methylobacter luteus TaxID=415 RepID=UPI0004267ACA|nr:hypothetical protein [Methylobacter luteus]
MAVKISRFLPIYWLNSSEFPRKSEDEALNAAALFGIDEQNQATFAQATVKLASWRISTGVKYRTTRLVHCPH